MLEAVAAAPFEASEASGQVQGPRKLRVLTHCNTGKILQPGKLRQLRQGAGQRGAATVKGVE